MPAAKTAIEKDVATNLPGFTINNESVGEFAGAPGYFVNASDQSKGVAYMEAAVLHSSSATGGGAARDNVFVFVHAVTGSHTDLTKLETAWRWK